MGRRKPSALADALKALQAMAAENTNLSNALNGWRARATVAEATVIRQQNDVANMSRKLQKAKSLASAMARAITIATDSYAAPTGFSIGSFAMAPNEAVALKVPR